MMIAKTIAGEVVGKSCLTMWRRTGCRISSRLSLEASLPRQHDQQMNAHFETFLWNQAIENKGALATNLSIVYSLIKVDIVPCLSANLLHAYKRADFDLDLTSAYEHLAGLDLGKIQAASHRQLRDTSIEQYDYNAITALIT
ncbi:hypothetical protein RHSIM_Rhsim08G0089300 [Rhododendron simsii]|uniref:Uncharacterized protein n=1 Tax=Rhododendron simsii TaxID=118357 RepID=A0A834GMX1_RHOSS|nr:hypothetical protein RHSIM_Rhsim08G0089300 [Rhododendron simsii]